MHRLVHYFSRERPYWRFNGLSRSLFLPREAALEFQCIVSSCFSTARGRVGASTHCLVMLFYCERLYWRFNTLSRSLFLQREAALAVQWIVSFIISPVRGRVGGSMHSLVTLFLPERSCLSYPIKPDPHFYVNKNDKSNGSANIQQPHLIRWENHKKK